MHSEKEDSGNGGNGWYLTVCVVQIDLITARTTVGVARSGIQVSDSQCEMSERLLTCTSARGECVQASRSE